jgi:hypothetical protein
MNLRLRASAVAGIATFALAIAGCGGGDDTSSTTAGASGASGASGTALTQDEFVSQANAICADANSQVEALAAPTNDVQGLGDYAATIVKISAPLIDQMAAIVPPADLQAQFDDYVQSIRDSSDTAQKLADAAKAGDTAQVNSLVAQLQKDNNDDEAKALGLTECAKDPQPQG